MFKLDRFGSDKQVNLALVVVLSLTLLAACGSNVDNSLLTPAAITSPVANVAQSPVAALPSYPPDRFGSTNVTAELNGSGSTFAQPIYSKWFPLYQAKNLAPNVKINYVADGSGNGRAAFLGTPVAATPAPKVPADFAGSDVPFAGTQLSNATTKGDIVHIPIALGGVALAYRLDGYKNALRLSGPTLAGIFLGNIKNWNEQAIANDNGVATTDLPAKPIKPVIRTRNTSSGTTEIFTRYLSVVSPEFRTAPGPSGAPNWSSAITLQGPGNPELADLISQNDGAIGYVDLNVAIERKLPTAAIRNQLGRYIAPTVESVTAAAQGLSIPDDFRIFVVNAEGENAYPIAGFTWLITWRDLGKLPNPSADKATALGNFIWWFIHAGQQNLPAGFAPLPASLVPRLEALFLNTDQSKVFHFNDAPLFTQAK